MNNIIEQNPLAITMWDFSWLERRWPGAGYENWDLNIKELTERGYNAVRIDAYPHLITNDLYKKWTLKQVWSQHDWGSPAMVEVSPYPSLLHFIEICAKYNVKVGLSTWYREDLDNTRMKITTPEIMIEQWAKTLNLIGKAGLLNSIFYIDLCNEWPGALWSPFFTNNPPDKTWGNWYSDVSMNWMKESIELFTKEFPEMPVGYSFDFRNKEMLLKKDLSFVDYGEPHIWMCQYNDGEFYKKVGYNYDLFKPDSYENLAAMGRKTFLENKIYWLNGLKEMIQDAEQYSQKYNQPLMTTECWGVVDYKDWPQLEWDWIKEICALGVEESAKTGKWAAIASSNFCGPQFKGMWNDVKWHQQITQVIKNAFICSDLLSTKLCKRNVPI